MNGNTLRPKGTARWLLLAQTLMVGLLSDTPAQAMPVNPPFSTFEIDGTTGLGNIFTLAFHANNSEAVLGFTRLASSFRGVGPAANDRILFDYDPTGGVIPGLRAIVNNTVVQTAAPPAGITNPGYHHYALTVNNGDVRIFFDGSEVAAGNVGLGYTNSANIQLGEDPHDGGGTANEQFLGNFDELLVITRALSSTEIMGLVSSEVDGVVTPVAGELAIYLNFELSLMDQFLLDGAQNGIARQNATIDSNPLNARQGRASGLLGDAADTPVPEPNTLALIGLGLAGIGYQRRRKFSA